MDKLIADIAKVQELIDKRDRTREENDFIGDMVLRIARFQASPSKLNALSILKSNPAERVARHLAADESRKF